MQESLVIHVTLGIIAGVYTCIDAPPHTQTQRKLMVMMLVDELLMLCMAFLCPHDLSACMAVNKRLRKLADSNDLWKPLALWCPGVGYRLAGECPLSWRQVVVLWNLWRIVRAARLDAAAYRASEKAAYNARRFHSEQLRQCLQALSNMRARHDMDERERQRLLTAHAVWRMQTGCGAHWSIVRPSSPPSADEMATAQTRAERSTVALNAAEAAVLQAKVLVRELVGHVEQLQRQRAHVLATIDDMESMATRMRGQPAAWHEQLREALCLNVSWSDR